MGTARFGPKGVLVERLPRVRGRRREPAGTDTAYDIFTSGTTGRPKGVERKILEYPGVRAAAVLVIRRGGRKPVLGAFVSMAPGAAAPRGTELNAFCARSVPWRLKSCMPSRNGR